MNKFAVSLIKQSKYNYARVMKIITPHGEFITPVFMPVGTRAGVNNMMIDELENAGSQIILGGNTYHMLCAPGIEIIENANGMHNFMGWHKPMLTDSGGFQVFSLSKKKEICVIEEDGARFSLPDNNKIIYMTPEMSLATQKSIGADIIMAFDECTKDNADVDAMQKAMLRTHRWLIKSCEYHAKYPNSAYGNTQALFGIIQGGLSKKFRCESAEFVASMEVQGIAIGGETIGFDMPTTVKVLQWIQAFLPQDKPRYTMGVGMSPQDLLDVVALGIDMFDCVAPTRNARHGALYAGELIPENNWLKFVSEYPQARLQIKKSCFAHDETPIMQSCICYTCKNYSKAYLHYLFKQKSILFSALGSIHNVTVMHETCRQMRNLILSE